MTDSYEYSIVIPTRNAGSEFPAVLELLQNQSVPPREIVIIDSYSHDETLKTAETFGCTTLQIQPADFNHGTTRNQAIRHTTTPFVGVMTQDAIPADRMLFERLLDSATTHHACGVYARQLPRDDASVLSARDVTGWISGSDKRRVIRFDSPEALWQACPIERYRSCVFDNVTSLLRRSIWERIPFPPTPFGEDIEWAFRVLCEQGTIVYEPTACVIHSHERSQRYVYQRTYIDHYRMYELFRLRTLPTRWHTWNAWLSTCIRDYRDLLTARGRPRHWLSVPGQAWASVWGQYDGASAAARGESARPTRGV